MPKNTNQAQNRKNICYLIRQNALQCFLYSLFPVRGVLVCSINRFLFLALFILFFLKASISLIKERFSVLQPIMSVFLQEISQLEQQRNTHAVSCKIV